jgi:hypothetical protein
MIACEETLPELFVVEWSEAQNAVHVSTMKRMIQVNRLAVLSDAPEGNSYYPVFVSTSETEARTYADGLQLRRAAKHAKSNDILELQTEDESADDCS